ncbi:phage tail protein [Scandinavium goeteborgense]|uniref:phage tail protein n=1 Tax=Scandinavium goeteborgense TaxID=1851514 RepID=UPI001FEC6617|nr:phage tail protein [Scandinavium goeteborgense]
MATKYLAVLTNVGAAKLANATALGAQVEITQMAVGDGNGVLPTPDPAQTALVHELRRAPLNSLSVDPKNPSQIIAEQVIPEDVGGWWIREIGLFDKDGDMIAVANCAETYKPLLQEGSGRVQVVRMILVVSSTAAVTLKIDPSVVLATRSYVDSQIIIAKSYADDVIADHLAEPNPHPQYLLSAQNLKEIADAGAAAVQAALTNLGINGLAATPRYLVSKGTNANGWYETYSDGFKRVGQSWGTSSPLAIPTPAQGARVNFPVSFTTKLDGLYVTENGNTSNSFELANPAGLGLTGFNLATVEMTLGSSVVTSYGSVFAGNYVAEGY